MKKLATYTAPAHLLEVERTVEVAQQPSYNDQRFGLSVDMESRTYRERMEPRKRLKSEPENENEKKSTGKTIPLTDDVLDRIIPKGYIKATPPDAQQVDAYEMPISAPVAAETLPEYDGIAMRKEDVRHFAVLLEAPREGPEARTQIRAAELVLRAKNGAPPVRRKAVRALRAQARELGPQPILSLVLPLMLEPALDEGDRHVLGKIVTRSLPAWDAEARPFVHQIVTAVGPQLLDPDMTLRLEARDCIAALARSAGFASLVASLRPDLDHSDEYVRNVTARVFAVVAVTLGLAKVVPFVRAVIKSKSAPARHTGIRIVHHICVLLGGGNGAAVLPHLASLVSVLQPALGDEAVHVRSAAAGTMAQLAESVRPYGAAALEPVMPVAWAALRQHRGRALASFMRCVAAVVPALAHDSAYEEHAAYYTRELVRVAAREFAAPDDDMRRSVLRVVASLPLSRAAVPQYRTALVAPFFRHMATRRAASDSQTARLVSTVAVHLAQLDVPYVVEQLCPLAKDANESLRRVAADALGKIVSVGNTTDNVSPTAALDDRAAAALLDAVLVAFQEQAPPHPVYLAAVAAVCRALGTRLTPHVPGLLSTVLYRMKHADAEVRAQAADLAAAVAPAIGADAARRLIVFFYESLGEVYPEVLGSVVGALRACLAALDPNARMALENPPLAALLPALTPILKNRHDKVQEQSILLVGLIARTGADTINAKEWMRVCYDLLDMLKSTRRRVRVAANATFGHIANTIGPQDVLAMLLDNLRVQERQLRVCTGVAIAIVADTCAPFTVLPALMNEYRVPDKNVQNSVLKALSFMFEYLDGATARPYVYAVAPLLMDALTDRDQVHRQTGATVVRHLALACAARGVHADLHPVFVHFLNLVLPNIYEVSPHVISRVVEALDALRIAVGAGVYLNYVWAGLFHAARKVRTPYWKLYNAAYVQHCDSLVPCYPRLEYDQLDELDVWI
ncbi:hypothetical protein FOB63_001541 [Clavispora lusitaniae]|uniref:Phosphatase PP2A regulatory subunit A/Splicing factor 3B subunit 1-like HEAT repeat domain-containing protein n=1 Tax=Clavispora lusitaniae (strain ATCC 42720) TaxID=306902 RepID=C4Y0W9_CLAL4|nr:uncharacterized protein CLUG_01851 [Clavispora lusitaniae ATCC 42720]EEQ37728.1 hypothetical protein CLUG_01851 [Clavispora lusitaniae ATCC 42720]KAF5211936.1 hypothetical protein E0198_001482 [Clavispora lusitaniae]KAF7583323.1 hypothetical protein FOB63_001541 [Clavispora lusitaniae]